MVHFCKGDDLIASSYGHEVVGVRKEVFSRFTQRRYIIIKKSYTRRTRLPLSLVPSVTTYHSVLTGRDVGFDREQPHPLIIDTDVHEYTETQDFKEHRVRHQRGSAPAPRRPALYPQSPHKSRDFLSAGEPLPRPRTSKAPGIFSQMNNEKIKKRSDGSKSHWLQIGWTTAPPESASYLSP